MEDSVIPTTADDVDGYDFDANASQPPGTRKGLAADPHAADPGHLATDAEWAQIVADAKKARK